MRLFDLTVDYRRLVDLAEECDEDFTEALDAIEGDLDDKVENTAAVVRELEAQSKAVKDEADRMAARAKSLANRAKGVKAWLQQCMDAAGKPKCKGPRFTVSVKDGPEGVVIDDETAVPDDFTKVVRQIDKAAVKRVWSEDGECVPGTHIARKRVLSIR